jgi:hypothetical protein
MTVQDSEHRADAGAAGPNPRTAKAVRGLFAGTLVLEGLTVLFVPRAVAQIGDGLTTTKLALSLSLAFLLFCCAGLMRRRIGLPLGTALQFALIACGVMTGAMYALGIIFTAIWGYELWIRVRLLRL